ncbi:unnamed protein product [Closterium sp. NIES-65]|nr:unnamed protein product [Closterium sp. NIES-65]
MFVTAPVTPVPVVPSVLPPVLPVPPVAQHPPSLPSRAPLPSRIHSCHSAPPSRASLPSPPLVIREKTQGVPGRRGSTPVTGRPPLSSFPSQPPLSSFPSQPLSSFPSQPLSSFPSQLSPLYFILPLWCGLSPPPHTPDPFHTSRSCHCHASPRARVTSLRNEGECGHGGEVKEVKGEDGDAGGRAVLEWALIDLFAGPFSAVVAVVVWQEGAVEAVAWGVGGAAVAAWWRCHFHDLSHASSGLCHGVGTPRGSLSHLHSLHAFPLALCCFTLHPYAVSPLPYNLLSPFTPPSFPHFSNAQLFPFHARSHSPSGRAAFPTSPRAAPPFPPRCFPTSPRFSIPQPHNSVSIPPLTFPPFHPSPLPPFTPCPPFRFSLNLTLPLPHVRPSVFPLVSPSFPP